VSNEQNLDNASCIGIFLTVDEGIKME